MILNPNLVASAPMSYTPSDASLDAAEDATQPVSVRDYPQAFKLLILLNSLAWVAYFMGWFE